jgi:hypothetical protein
MFCRATPLRNLAFTDLGSPMSASVAVKWAAPYLPGQGLSKHVYNPRKVDLHLKLYIRSRQVR